MNSVWALAKLSISNIWLDAGYGGIPNLTQADISGALAGCPLEAYYFGRFKFAGDYSVMTTLEKMVYSQLAADGLQQQLFDKPHYQMAINYFMHWPMYFDRGYKANKMTNVMTKQAWDWCTTLHRLAILLIDDVVFENIHKTCGGTGFYQYRVCKGCAGSGRKLLTTSEQARRLKLSNYLYTRYWQPLFERFLPVLQAWESKVIDHLRKQLSVDPMS